MTLCPVLRTANFRQSEKNFLTAPTVTHTESNRWGFKEALPPDWSQKFGPSPFRSSHVLDLIPEGLNFVRVTFSRRSPTKEFQFPSVASSLGPPHIDLLNSLNVASAFSLCFAHSSSLISGGGSWGGG
jgi:hypothetical protein